LRACYALFVFGGFLNATGDLWPALLSGINGVQAAQRILVGSAFINFVTTVGGLLSHLGIWSLVIATVCAGAFIRWAGRVAFSRRAGLKFDQQSRPDFGLIGTLWPTAWRSGLVSLGGFLVVSANTLICSAFLDLKRTASYGLSLSIIAILTYASSTFIQIKLPVINQLRATNRMNDIVELWIQRTRISVTFFILGGLVLLFSGNLALHTIGAKTLLLPQPQLALALLIFGLEMHHSLYAGLIISENQNPFVAPALISGTATLALSLLLTPRLGVWGMLLAQGISQACFNNWWTVYRAIRGLGLSWTEYWQRYVRSPIHI
jgi:O-antigen/teichoic acid export membrane protein